MANDPERRERRSANRTQANRDERGQRSSGGLPAVGRRQYLRLVGAAGVATTAAATAGTAGATTHYTTYTVGSGETFRRDLGSDDTLENVFIDATANDTDVDIDAYGSNWTIRNVGIKGQLDSTDSSVFTLQVNEGSTGLFENIYLGAGSIDGGHGGLFVPTSHEGRLLVRELNVQYWADNGEYASAPGRSERGARGGLVEIERSYARNNNIAGFRLGTDRSVVRDSVVLVDEEPPANSSGAINARGIWVKEGGSVEIENCDILLDHPEGSYCVWEGDDNSVSLARVIDSEIAARDGADGKYKGNVEMINVGNDPNVEQPPDVPLSAKEAALGRNLSKSIEFAGGTDSDMLAYTLETTGEIAGTRSTEAGDDVSGGQTGGTQAAGATGGDSDIFTYSGELTSLNADVPADGSLGSLTIDRSNGRIRFEGGSRNTDRYEYYVRVTGSIIPGESTEDHDAVSNEAAKGRLVSANYDAYDYTGEITDLRARLPENGSLLSVSIDAA
ncbi:hypothetical protein BRC86_12085 [Halobacteriales archaeon QS_3_64_16]|nr:MAG: hypothetical protein BRC86_12085 [Halobacteriales archaeon QS_3_64_16]